MSDRIINVHTVTSVEAGPDACAEASVREQRRNLPFLGLTSQIYGTGCGVEMQARDVLCCKRQCMDSGPRKDAHSSVPSHPSIPLRAVSDGRPVSKTWCMEGLSPSETGALVASHQLDMGASHVSVN